MPEIELTPELEAIVRKMLEEYDAGHFDQFVYSATFAHTGFQYNGVHKIDAEPLQVRKLANAGIIHAEFFDQEGAGMCSLNEPAARKALRDLGRLKRTRVLNAAYDLSDGKVNTGATMTDIMKRARVTQQEFETAFLTLANERLVTASSGSGAGPVVYLEPAGIRHVESEGQRGLLGAINVHMNRSNVTIGNNNTVNAQQNDGMTPGEAIDLLKARTDDAAKQMEAVERLLKSVLASVKAGEDPGPGWGERLTKLAESAAKVAAFGTAAVEIARQFGH